MKALRAAPARVFRGLASLLDSLLEGRGRHRRKVALALYAGVSAFAYGLSYLLRFEFAIPPRWVDSLFRTLPLLVVIRLFFSWVFGLAVGRWRFVGTEDVLRLVASTAAGSLCFFLVVWTVDIVPTVPRSVILIEWFVTTLLTAGLWVSYRLVFERARHRRTRAEPKRVLIVGAGEAGNLLAREIRRYPTGYRLVGFVDDDQAVRGSTVRGVEVVGTTEELAGIAERTGADEIIIAVPSATPTQLRRIVTRCEPLDRPFKVLPGISEVLGGDVSVHHLRELQIEDLLGREPISLELPELEAELTGKRVLITGGAGSIGSELARQVALYEPASLLLLDIAESDVYFLERELRERHPRLELVPLIGNILDDRGLERVFDAHRPDRVYHAAAYKHVPLMERNPREAVRNNVLGTWNVARAAGRWGSESFTLISTDKAVEPTSVMGATKRVAERVCLACQELHPDTAFLAVRFGNVLGSQGSVIPLFQKQLRKGKPLTVTDPDVTRYFMTISEAVQLILQASVLPDARGHIAMLDMGEPVRILDLAKDLIRLAGLRPGTDVEIRFIGLRPGEKLHEQLESQTEETVRTEFEKVRIIRRKEGASSEAWILPELEALGAGLAELSEEALRSELFALVDGERTLAPGPGVVGTSGLTRAVD